MAYPYRKRGRWYIGFKNRLGQQEQRCTKAKTKTEAKRLADEEERKEERIRLGIEPAPLPPNLFSEVVEDYLKKEAVSKSSKPAIEARLNNHLLPRFKDILLGDIKPADINEFLASKNRALNPKNPLSPQSCEHLRVLLQGIFTFAIKKAKTFRGENPAAPPACPRVDIPPRDPRFLTSDEVGMVLAAVEDRWRGLFATAVYTGLRKGELCGLRVESVDLPRRLIFVTRSYGGNTKGKRARTVPIPDELAPYLRAELGRARSEWLFPAPDGSMQSSDFKLARIFKLALKNAGLVVGYEHICRRKGCAQSPERRADSAPRPCPKCGMASWPEPVPKDLSFKDLRSTFGTLAYEATDDIRFVQNALGHGDVATTEIHYSKLRDDRLRQQANKIRFGTYPALTGPDSPATTTAAPRKEASVISIVSTEKNVARPEGVEPPTLGFEGQNGNFIGFARGCTELLSLATPTAYTAHSLHGVPSSDPSSPAFSYPALTGVAGQALLTAERVAERLSMSRETVYRLAKRGALPVVRIGASVRFSAEAVAAFIRARGEQ